MSPVSRALAIVLAVLLVAEGVAQLVVYRFSGREFDSLSNYTWSPYGLVRNNPALNSDGFIISRDGFRATRSYCPSKPPNTLRVMLMGGSVLYSGLGGPATLVDAYGRTPSSKTVAPYMEAMLRADPAFRGVNVEVINAAVNFNRITEISGAYLADYLQWRADYIVVFGSVNNFSSVRYNGQFEAGTTDLQKWHPWRSEFERVTNHYDPASMVERVWRMASEHSAAAAIAKKLMEKVADRWVATADKLAPAKPALKPMFESDEERRRYFAFFATHGEAMIAAARNEGTGIAFVWEPVLGDLGGIKRMSAEEVRIYPAVRRGAAEAKQYNDTRLLMKDWLNRKGVPFVDPTTDIANNPRTLFMDYGHYVPEGHRVVAGVAYRLLRPQLLERAAAIRSAEEARSRLDGGARRAFTTTCDRGP